MKKTLIFIHFYFNLPIYCFAICDESPAAASRNMMQQSHLDSLPRIAPILGESLGDSFAPSNETSWKIHRRTHDRESMSFNSPDNSTAYFAYCCSDIILLSTPRFSASLECMKLVHVGSPHIDSAHFSNAQSAMDVESCNQGR